MPQYDPNPVVDSLIEAIVKKANFHGNELEVVSVSRQELEQLVSSTLVSVFEDGYYRGHAVGYDEGKW
jgi:hypothetical protein